MNKITLIIFIAGTIVILLLSWWISLRHKHYHGIYRFFALECIFLLTLLNYPVWFKDPFSFRQIISWILLIISIPVGVAGFYSYYRIGKPSDKMEKTTQLITVGIFKFIRHPLYLSLIILGFGIMMKDLNYVSIVVGFTNFISLYFTAKTEEQEMIKKFGNRYVEYIKQTKMFMPFIL